MPQGVKTKTFPVPVFDLSKNRWKLDIPASIAGKRKIMTFTSQSEALDAASKMAQGIESGEGLSIPAPRSTNTLDGLVGAFLLELEQKTKQGLSSKDNLVTLRWGLSKFVERFGKIGADQVTPALIDSWLKSSPYKTRGRFNLFACCRTFYNSRLIKDLCPLNPFRDVPPKKDRNARLPILTPAQMRTLLALDVAPFFKAWIVAGGFSGIRSCEFERISYESIDYEHDEIVIKREESKQGEASRPRSIPIYPAFKRHMPAGEGPLDGGASWKKVDDEMAKALKALKWKHWEKNTLRHSFASYALASNMDAAKTAYQMGHTSPTLLYSCYGNAVSKKDADEWWSL